MDFGLAVGEAAWTVLANRSPALRRDYVLQEKVIGSTRLWANDLAAASRPELPDRLAQLIKERNWPAAFRIACPREVEDREHTWRSWHAISLCIEMILTIPDVEQWPRLLATFLVSGDNPTHEYRRLCPIFGLLHGLGLRVFDNSAASAAFDGLPERVKVFRGTVKAEIESGDYGFCWTLDRDVAGLYATVAERIRELVPGATRSPAVIAVATVCRNDIVGMLFHQSEVLICPEKLNDIKINIIKAVAAPGVIR